MKSYGPVYTLRICEQSGKNMENGNIRICFVFCLLPVMFQIITLYITRICRTQMSC